MLAEIIYVKPGRFCGEINCLTMRGTAFVLADTGLSTPFSRGFFNYVTREHGFADIQRFAKRFDDRKIHYLASV